MKEHQTKASCQRESHGIPLATCLHILALQSCNLCSYSAVPENLSTPFVWHLAGCFAGLKRLAKDGDYLTATVAGTEQLLEVDAQNSHRVTTLVKLDMRELSQRFAAVYEPGESVHRHVHVLYLGFS